MVQAKRADAQKIKQPLAVLGGESLRKENPLRDSSTAPSAPSSQLSVSDTLDQRGPVYGSFRENSRVAVSLLEVINAEQKARTVPLPDYEYNALVMIAEKMSRILVGKSHEDNWIDIAGYAELGRNPR